MKLNGLFHQDVNRVTVDGHLAPISKGKTPNSQASLGLLASQTLP
jgi:hypothetical protein